MLNRRLIVWGLLLELPLTAYAQTCRIETEVPSTTPISDFIDHGDGTVTHKRSGLMWMKCSLGQSGADCTTGGASDYSWQQALEVTDGYSFAGYADWRLPNISELSSIVEQRCYEPAINLDVFPSTPSTLSNSIFWSTSPHANNSNYVWNVEFSTGANDLNVDRDDYLMHVRLVRSGQ